MQELQKMRSTGMIRHFTYSDLDAMCGVPGQLARPAADLVTKMTPRAVIFVYGEHASRRTAVRSRARSPETLTIGPMIRNAKCRIIF